MVLQQVQEELILQAVNIMELTEQQIKEQANIFHVSEDFVKELLPFVDDIKTLQEKLYKIIENQRDDIPQYFREKAEVINSKMEKETGIKSTPQILKINFSDSGHKCIFEKFPENNRPCFICPLHTKNRLLLASSAARMYMVENDLTTINEKLFQRIFDSTITYIDEFKDKIVSDIIQKLKEFDYIDIIDNKIITKIDFASVDDESNSSVL